jgi:hypothetical protein
MITSLLKLFVVGLVAIVAISVVLGVVAMIFGLAIGLASLLVFKVLPVVLVGYLVLRLFKPKRPQLSKADQEWLES